MHPVINPAVSLLRDHITLKTVNFKVIEVNWLLCGHPQPLRNGIEVEASASPEDNDGGPKRCGLRPSSSRITIHPEEVSYLFNGVTGHIG